MTQPTNDLIAQRPTPELLPALTGRETTLREDD